MALIIFHAPREAPGSYQELTRLRVITMGLLARKRFARNFLQQSLAEPYARYGKAAQIQIAPQRDKRDRRDAHHVRTVPPHRVRLHSLAHVAPQDVVQPFPQKRKL